MNYDNKIAEYQEATDKLVGILHKEYNEIYDWLNSRGINLRELHFHLKNIATAAVFSFSVLNYHVVNTDISLNSGLEKFSHVLTMNADQMQVMSPEERKIHKVYNEYNEEILHASKKYEVDPKIILATIIVESGGNTKAIRYEPAINDSSYGLGQILYSTAKMIGFEGQPDQLYNPAVNIDLIARYHKLNLNTYGELTNEQLATAYNSGNPYGRATYGHVDKFMKWYKIADKINIGNI